MNDTIKNISDLSISDIPISSNIEYTKDLDLSNVYDMRSIQDGLAHFIGWWDLVKTLSHTVSNSQSTIIESSDQDNQSIQGTVKTNNHFNSEGLVDRDGIECPQCKNKVKSLQVGGFCSAKCAEEYSKTMSQPYNRPPKDIYKTIKETLQKIKGILNHISLLMNCLVAIPDIINELHIIPEPYKDFVNEKINEGYCLIYASIQKLMIKKATLLQQMMKPIKYGNIPKPLKIVFSSIMVLLDTMEASQTVFDVTYTNINAIIKQLEHANMGGAIEGEGIAWIGTPHSFMSNSPTTNPDKGKIFVNLPGGSGKKNIALAKPLMPSAIQNLDFQSIESLIQSLFPPLQPEDYYLDPELFGVRLLFSDQSNIVFQIRQQLEDLFTFQLDYLPKYENMLPTKITTYIIDGNEIDMALPNIGYVWFLLGLLDSWAPHSKALVGSLINPNI